MTEAVGQYTNVTLVDVHLAAAYYPLLVNFAKCKRPVTYGDLVEQAKQRYPDCPVVQSAIAVSTGRRLDVVRMFTSARNLPDLTSLVINKGSGECGTGFTRSFDPEAARQVVLSFDWSSVSTEFDGFLKHTETVIKPRKAVKEPQALELMYAYYREHKGALPSSVSQHREQIVELIKEGFSPKEAFDQALQNGA